MEEIKLINGKMCSHMTLAKEAMRVDSVEIDCKNHIQHGQKIFIHTHTKRKSEFEWAKGEMVFTSDTLPKKEFADIQELLKALGLPTLTH